MNRNFPTGGEAQGIPVFEEHKKKGKVTNM